MVHLSTYLLASVYPNLFSVYPLSVQPSLTYGDPHMHTVFLMHAGIHLFFVGCLNLFLCRIQIHSFQLLPPDSNLSKITPKELADKVFSKVKTNIFSTRRVNLHTNANTKMGGMAALWYVIHLAIRAGQKHIPVCTWGVLVCIQELPISIRGFGPKNCIWGLPVCKWTLYAYGD